MLTVRAAAQTSRIQVKMVYQWQTQVFPPDTLDLRVAIHKLQHSALLFNTILIYSFVREIMFLKVSYSGSSYPLNTFPFYTVFFWDYLKENLHYKLKQ